MTTGREQGAGPAAPHFSGERIVFLVTGSINAALVPYWLNWLRVMYPQVVSHVAVTRSAHRFISKEPLRRLVDGSVWTDDWDDPNLPDAAHIEIDDMTDCYAVFPATLDCTMRLAGGRSDTPLLLTLQTTEKPIALATAFPGRNQLIDNMTQRLLQRPNIELTSTVPAYSVGRKSWSGETGFFMPSVLTALERMLGSAGCGDEIQGSSC